MFPKPLSLSRLRSAPTETPLLCVFPPPTKATAMASATASSTGEDQEDFTAGRAAAEREKSIAERNFNDSSLNSALKHARRAQKLCPDLPGVAQLVTSLRVHLAAGASATIAGDPDWYAVLQSEPFSSLDRIKSQYRKLALVLHPDKSRQCPGAEDAFKLVGQAWAVLSDRSRRSIYDLKRRIELEFQTSSVAPLSRGDETFSTECTTCKRLHEFERKFIGRKLVCPKCKKAFLATEIGSPNPPNSCDLRMHVEIKQKKEEEEKEEVEEEREEKSVKLQVYKRRKKEETKHDKEEQRKEKKKRFSSSTVDVSQAPTIGLTKDVKDDSDLGDAFAWKKKIRRSIRGKRKRRSGFDELHLVRLDGKEKGPSPDRPTDPESVAMRVVDSDFYDFDQDRKERSFLKGQVWAIYDDDDGMPRHYGLIDEIMSTDPFRLRMSWLDLRNNGEETIICGESSGLHVACGQFKISRRIEVETVNIFSHLVESVRVAKEIYRIYPMKDSIWAFYSDQNLDRNGRSLGETNRRYDMVVCLTNFTDAEGLSFAYLEKVEGFKTIFQRKEVGPFAIHWLGKDDTLRISHQIPAKKLSGREDATLPNVACWELDPASLSIV